MIDAVTFMRYQIDFVCEDRRFGFSISSPFCFGLDDQIQDMPWAEFPLSHTDVPRALGSTIVSAKTDEQQCLRIKLSTGDTLLASWIPIYESYQLLIDGERMIV